MRALLVLVLFVVLSFSLVSVVSAGFGDTLGSAGKQVATVGINTGLSLLLGWWKKKTPIPNRAIPATNAGVCAGGTAMVTAGDPLATGLAVVGSMFGNVLYDVFRKK